MENNQVFKRNIEFRLRKIGAKNYLFSSNTCFELNEIGAIIWNVLDGVSNLQQIGELISKEYDVQIGILIDDIKSYMQFLLENNVIIKVVNESAGDMF